MEPTIEERAWLKRFERVLRDMPKSMWLFAGGAGGLYAYRKENGKHAMTDSGSVDQAFEIGSFGWVDADGGDW